MSSILENEMFLQMLYLLISIVVAYLVCINIGHRDGKSIIAVHSLILFMLITFQLIDLMFMLVLVIEIVILVKNMDDGGIVRE